MCVSSWCFWSVLCFGFILSIIFLLICAFVHWTCQIFCNWWQVILLYQELYQEILSLGKDLVLNEHCINFKSSCLYVMLSYRMFIFLSQRPGWDSHFNTFNFEIYWFFSEYIHRKYGINISRDKGSWRSSRSTGFYCIEGQNQMLLISYVGQTILQKCILWVSPHFSEF